MTQRKEGRCKKPFGFSSINSGQGRSNAGAWGGWVKDRLSAFTLNVLSFISLVQAAANIILVSILWVIMLYAWAGGQAGQVFLLQTISAWAFCL